MPIYFIGLNQLTSPSLFGSLRLSSRSLSTSPAASSAMRIVRHGVANGRSRMTRGPCDEGDRGARNFWPSTRLNHMRSEEHTSELQSLMRNSYAVFCLTTQKRTHNAK